MIIFMIIILFVCVKHFQKTFIKRLLSYHLYHFCAILLNTFIKCLLFDHLNLSLLSFLWYFQITFVKGFRFFNCSFSVCYPTLRNKIETLADGYSLWSNSSSQSCFGNTIFNFFYLLSIHYSVTSYKLVTISAKLVLCVRLFLCVFWRSLSLLFFFFCCILPSVADRQYCKHFGSLAGGAWHSGLSGLCCSQVP